MQYDVIADKALDQFKKRLAKVIGKFQKDLLVKLSAYTANGKLLSSPEALQYSAQLYTELITALNDAGYSAIVAEFQGSDADMIKALRAESTVPLVFSETSKEVIRSLQLTQSFGFQAVGDNAMNAIRESVMQSMLIGAPIESLMSSITAELDTKLARYAWTYANTTRREVIQTAIDEGIQRAERIANGEEIYYEYVGVLDDKTRDACLIGLEQQYFTDAERVEFEATYADERAYNCRHDFMEISKEVYEEKQ